jgi:hypothetical protein
MRLFVELNAAKGCYEPRYLLDTNICIYTSTDSRAKS